MIIIIMCIGIFIYGQAAVGLKLTILVTLGDEGMEKQEGTLKNWWKALMQKWGLRIRTKKSEKKLYIWVKQS